MDKNVIGIIHVLLSAFVFPSETGRERDQAIIRRLTRLFTRAGCKPNKWENHIDGAIGDNTYKKILAYLKCSKASLLNLACDREYLWVNLHRSITCLNRKHRIAAAKNLLSDKA